MESKQIAPEMPVDHLSDYGSWVKQRSSLIDSLFRECEMTTSKNLNLPTARFLTTFERFLIDKVDAFISLPHKPYP